MRALRPPGITGARLPRRAHRRRRGRHCQGDVKASDAGAFRVPTACTSDAPRGFEPPTAVGAFGLRSVDARVSARTEDVVNSRPCDDPGRLSGRRRQGDGKSTYEGTGGF